MRRMRARAGPDGRPKLPAGVQETVKIKRASQNTHTVFLIEFLSFYVKTVSIVTNQVVR